jgi:hypothetical protein
MDLKLKRLYPHHRRGKNFGARWKRKAGLHFVGSKSAADERPK